MAARSCRSITVAVKPAAALVGQLPDAGDRHQPVRDRGGDLGRDRGIGLVVVLPPLRVAQG